MKQQLAAAGKRLGIVFLIAIGALFALVCVFQIIFILGIWYKESFM
ncbi:MAG: hypothetical protein K0R67_1435 [Paenibacillus sp.]|jgi:hypothetical protein|nr:hypothetical protein [Paenibacillus sp.]